MGAAVASAGMAYAGGSPRILVNQKELETECIVQNDRIFVPLRAVSEGLGAQVDWNEQAQTASITLEHEGNVSQVIAQVSKSVVAIVGNYADDRLSQSEHVQSMAHGTGVVIKSGGEILTNAHVVKNLKQIIVVMSDGQGYEGRLKYIDEESDLAVVKIDRIGMKPISFADAGSVVPGQTVVAIGTPVSFSLRNSASKGIISGVHCQIGESYHLIQTDAAINPGNSGGPLVNLRGELVGINSAKFAATGIEGMGFSIPVDTVQYVISQFERYGKVRRAKTGIVFEESWASMLGLPTREGLTVQKVAAGSKGEQAGLQVGDVVTKIGEEEVHSLADYHEVMKKYVMGDTAYLTVERGGESLWVGLVLSDE